VRLGSGVSIPADPSKGEGQPNASWDPIGHWDVKTGSRGETVRVLPDGTRVDHFNNPIAQSSSSGAGAEPSQTVRGPSPQQVQEIGVGMTILLLLYYAASALN
jgi:hypothetical protein